MSHVEKTKALTIASLIMLVGCSTPEPKIAGEEKKGWSALEWQYANWRKSAFLPPQIQVTPLGLDRATGDAAATQISVSPVTSPGSASGPFAALPTSGEQPVAPAVFAESSAALPTPATEIVLPLAAAAQNGVSVPPNQCWAQVVIPPRRTESEKVLTLREETTRHEVTQPVIEKSVQQVVVKDAASVYKVEPPRFKPVAERVLVSEAVPKLVIDPAVYETQEETVEVESSRIMMRSCRGAGQTVSSSPADQRNAVLCATELPARYKSISKKVLVKPEIVREEVTPAVYKTVTRMVLEQPARVTEVPLPEVRKPMPLQTLQRPGQAQAQSVPAQTTAIPVVKHEGLPFLTWRRTLCERDMNRDLVAQLQEALGNAGVDIGKADGKMGKRTWLALQNYQQQEGLASGHLTYETLERLKIKAP